MVVHTNSQKVRMTRRVNLQLLLSQHEVNCVKCTRSGNCKLQKLANDYNLLGAPYQKKLRRRYLLAAVLIVLAVCCAALIYAQVLTDSSVAYAEEHITILPTTDLSEAGQ